MKTIPKSLCTLLAAALFLIASHPSYAGSEPAAFITHNDARYVVVVNKNQNNRKHKIRLYADAGQDKLLFSVNGIGGQQYQLYMFDMDGRLILQANIRNRETSVLVNMPKGNYLFEVMTNDEEIGNGQLTIK